MNALVAQLRAIARMRGETLQAIDRRAGYTPDTLSRWARPHNNPRLTVFEDYAQALDHRLELVPDGPIDIPKFLPVR